MYGSVKRIIVRYKISIVKYLASTPADTCMRAA